MNTELTSLIKDADAIWTQLTTLTNAKPSARTGKITPGLVPSAKTAEFKAIYTALVTSQANAEQQRGVLTNGLVQEDYLELWKQQGALEDKNKAIQELFNRALNYNLKVKEAIFPSKNEEGKEDTSK